MFTSVAQRHNIAHPCKATGISI